MLFKRLLIILKLFSWWGLFVAQKIISTDILVREVKTTIHHRKQKETLLHLTYGRWKKWPFKGYQCSMVFQIQICDDLPWYFILIHDNIWTRIPWWSESRTNLNVFVLCGERYFIVRKYFSNFYISDSVNTNRSSLIKCLPSSLYLWDYKPGPWIQLFQYKPAVMFIGSQKFAICKV